MPRTLGIVGGIAPASTLDYYRLLVAQYRAQRPEGSYPLVVINCIDLQHFIAIVNSGDRPRLVEHLMQAVDRLAQGGADFALFASNTPHLVFEELEARSPIPLLSIVEVTAAAAKAAGFKRVGLLGTRFTMEGGFYAKVFARHGIVVEVPGSEDRTYVHEHYFTELVNEVFLPTTRDGMAAVIDRLRGNAEVEAVILGGTELPMLFRGGPPLDLPLLDTTQLHVAEAVNRLLDA